MTTREPIIGWYFDAQETPDSYGAQGDEIMGYRDALDLAWEGWHDWLSDCRNDGAIQRQALAGCWRKLRRLQPNDCNGLHALIEEFNLFDGFDDYRGPCERITYDVDGTQYAAYTLTDEQRLIDTGQAHRESIPCGCIDWPCCGCDSYVLTGGAT